MVSSKPFQTAGLAPVRNFRAVHQSRTFSICCLTFRAVTGLVRHRLGSPSSTRITCGTSIIFDREGADHRLDMRPHRVAPVCAVTVGPAVLVLVKILFGRLLEGDRPDRGRQRIAALGARTDAASELRASL